VRVEKEERDEIARAICSGVIQFLNGRSGFSVRDLDRDVQDEFKVELLAQIKKSLPTPEQE
jgi:hypothetical protein